MGLVAVTNSGWEVQGAALLRIRQSLECSFPTAQAETGVQTGALPAALVAALIKAEAVEARVARSLALGGGNMK